MIQKKTWMRYLNLGLNLILINVLMSVSCEDVDYAGSRDMIYKNESSYKIEYYVYDYSIQKDSLLFELAPKTEIKFEDGVSGGSEDGGSVDNCCEFSINSFQGQGAITLKYLEGDGEKCISFDGPGDEGSDESGIGPGYYSNYGIVKKGFNHFELTYVFTDSIINTGAICE